jgi:hypothetical protein
MTPAARRAAERLHGTDPTSPVSDVRRATDPHGREVGS